MGAQWLSDRMLESRPRGRGFEPHRRHCVVSLSKNTYPSLVLIQPRKTCPYTTEKLLMGRQKSNQNTYLLRFVEIIVRKIYFILWTEVQMGWCRPRPPPPGTAAKENLSHSHRGNCNFYQTNRKCPRFGYV